jgi:hypothetical protein
MKAVIMKYEHEHRLRQNNKQKIMNLEKCVRLKYIGS